MCSFTRGCKWRKIGWVARKSYASTSADGSTVTVDLDKRNARGVRAMLRSNKDENSSPQFLWLQFSDWYCWCRKRCSSANESNHRAGLQRLLAHICLHSSANGIAESPSVWLSVCLAVCMSAGSARLGSPTHFHSPHSLNVTREPPTPPPRLRDMWRDVTDDVTVRALLLDHSAVSTLPTWLAGWRSEKLLRLNVIRSVALLAKLSCSKWLCVVAQCTSELCCTVNLRLCVYDKRRETSNSWDARVGMRHIGDASIQPDCSWCRDVFWKV